MLVFAPARLTNLLFLLLLCAGRSMTQFFEVHPLNPQARLLKQAVTLLAQGGVLAVPTDSSYALVCHLDDKAAADRLRQIRGIDDKHLLTLLCRDLAQLSQYAIVDNRQYRLLKHATPGAYTFVLEATKEVPRRVSHPSRKTIGLRVPDHAVIQTLLELHEAPLLATTLIVPGDAQPLNNAREISQRYPKQLAGVVDGGACSSQPTTVINLTTQEPQIERLGGGDIARLGLSL
jgi:tRNA threonylcarbamoyl adenosine modification protein (Sua5/YciO/YrdC/YwlC family)